MSLRRGCRRKIWSRASCICFALALDWLRASMSWCCESASSFCSASSRLDSFLFSISCDSSSSCRLSSTSSVKRRSRISSANWASSAAAALGDGAGASSLASSWPIGTSSFWAACLASASGSMINTRRPGSALDMARASVLCFQRQQSGQKSHMRARQMITPAKTLCDHPQVRLPVRQKHAASRRRLGSHGRLMACRSRPAVASLASRAGVSGSWASTGPVSPRIDRPPLALGLDGIAR